MLVRQEDIAVGVNTGGVHGPARVRALHRAVLSSFDRVVILGDEIAARGSKQIQPVPQHFSCAGNRSSFGASPWAEEDGNASISLYSARGRCTQLRFLYVLQVLRLQHPSARYYLLLDDDVYVDVPALLRLLSQLDPSYSPSTAWMMGAAPSHESVAHTSDDTSDGMVFGSTLVFSHELMRRLDAHSLMRCASRWMFSCARGCCTHCTAAARAVQDADFHRCEAALQRQCGEHAHSASALARCTKALQAKSESSDSLLSSCRFDTDVRPESPRPIFIVPPQRWNGNHGDDHWLSFCTRAASHGNGTLLTQPCFQWNRAEFAAPPVSCTAGSIVSRHRVRPSDSFVWSKLGTSWPAMGLSALVGAHSWISE